VDGIFLVIFLKDRQLHARFYNKVTACLGVYVQSLRYTCAIDSTVVTMACTGYSNGVVTSTF